MNDFLDLTGRLWSQAEAMLRAQGFGAEAVQVIDITPHEERRGSHQPFEWGEPRVVRARSEGTSVQVTVAREMK